MYDPVGSHTIKALLLYQTVCSLFIFICIVLCGNMIETHKPPIRYIFLTLSLEIRIKDISIPNWPHDQWSFGSSSALSCAWKTYAI